LNGKAAELKNMINLPIKRDHRLFELGDKQIELLSPKQVSDLVESVLQYLSTSPQLATVQLKQFT